MAKNKLLKYERVKHLPNVTFSKFGESKSPLSYTWYDKQYRTMKKILELGCGKGEHSLAFAAAGSKNMCIGIDSKSHRICVGAEKAISLGLDNVHFLHARIEDLDEFFTEHSIQEIWLTFPDPHPKTRTIKNRLSGPSFLDTYAHLLVPGGTVHLKTDSDLLYNYTRESVEQWGGKIIGRSCDIHGIDSAATLATAIVSTFENKALKKGATIKYMAFTLTDP